RAPGVAARGRPRHRVAVLLALQLAHERSPGCLAGLIPALVALLGGADARLRGDVADLLGVLGDARARAPLAALRGDPDADVAEAVAEALARLGA
ncbi:MAG TPA: HEAT repeat domain-containing protein, partial [Polyangia bacterium]